MAVPKAESLALYERAKGLGLDATFVLWKDMPHGQAESGPGLLDWPEGNDWWESGVVPSMKFLWDRVRKD